MCGLDVNALEHLAEKQVSRLFVGAFEDKRGHEVDEEASDGVGVSDQVQHEFYQLFFQFSLQRYHDILNKLKSTVSNLRLLVTLSWHSSSHAK